MTFPDTVLIYWVIKEQIFMVPDTQCFDFYLLQTEHIKFYGIQKGGGIMASSSNASKCCSVEKKKLMAELEKCNFCSDDYESFHDCYRKAAQESGQRSRACMIS